MASIREQVAEMLHGRYRNEEVEQAVLADAEKQGSLERIVEGELQLPSRQDATHWHERITGKVTATPKEAQQAKLIDDLSSRLAALESRSPPMQHNPDHADEQSPSETPHQ